MSGVSLPWLNGALSTPTVNATAPEPTCAQIDHVGATLGVVFERERRGDAVTQHRRIGEDGRAGAAGVVARIFGLVGHVRDVRDIEERLRLAEGEPGELDEGAVEINGVEPSRRSVVGVGRPLPAGADDTNAACRIRSASERRT